jgi:DNA helicase-2/ATP-dependent DNA helicase PcrA
VSTFSYPTRRAIANGEESVEEERRCLYVAVTRAKDELYIYRDVHSIHATGQYANDDENMYFLNGLPESLVQTEVLGDFNWTIDDSAGYSGDQIDDSVNDDFDFT